MEMVCVAAAGCCSCEVGAGEEAVVGCVEGEGGEWCW